MPKITHTRSFLIAAVSLFLFFQMSGFAQNTSESPPNIIVFIADDAGMDFGCYGNEGIQTPNIDKLAAEGMKFDRAFLTTSQCSPTRTSLLSGCFPHTIGTGDLHTPLGSDVKLIPNYLKQKDYFTGIMLKTHLGKFGSEQFDWYDNGWTQYNKGTWNKQVEENFQIFLDAAGEKPFFMWCAFIDPHKPYGDSINGAPKVHRTCDVNVPPYLVDNEDTREELALYYDEIHRMDKKIGLMLHELENRQIADNTLVIFFSDNGFPFPRGKATVYDSGIRTPLVIRWKGHTHPGICYEGLLSMIDLAPTLLDLGGAEIPEIMYGQSISGILEDPSLPGRKRIYAERNWHDSEAYMRCIRSERYKLIYNGHANLQFPITGDYWNSGAWRDLLNGKQQGILTPGQSRIFEFPRPVLELYDLENDPFELVNLITEPAYVELIETLNNELLNWQIGTNDVLPRDILRKDIVDRKTGYLYNMRRIRDLENNQSNKQSDI